MVFEDFKRIEQEQLKHIDDLVASVGEREFEQRVAKMAETEPDNFYMWSSCYLFSRDSMMKHHYLKQMVECIRRKGSSRAYMDGIYFTHGRDLASLNRQLAVEMVDRHPVAGRLWVLLYSIPPACWLCNPFD